ncbi:MAG: hypothetical protein HY293_19760 [Planctomycetes bacterium]|nr:hypothetical protein [Planctomycetota bacterium]
MKPRMHLGGDAVPGGYRRVFEIEGGLEIDENNFVEIERTRVYFDDVLGITYHRQLGAVFLVAMGLLALFLSGIALLFALMEHESGGVVAIVFLCMASPFGLAFLIRLILKVDVITVFGRRTMATMKFPFRKGRARGIYRDLALKIRASQGKALAAEPPPPAPPPPPEMPPPSSPAAP